MTTLQSVARANGKNHRLIEQIRQEFATGEKIVEILCSDPVRFRHTFYDAVRRRGLLWRFAILEKSLFVIKK